MVDKAELFYCYLTPHFDFAFQRYLFLYICFFPSSFHSSLLVCVPFCCPPSAAIFSFFSPPSTSTSQILPSLFHSSILYTCQSKALPLHLCSIAVLSLSIETHCLHQFSFALKCGNTRQNTVHLASY